MSQQFSFANFLNKKWQIKKAHGEFQQGEVLHIQDYISDKKGAGFLVTYGERKRISEDDAKRLLVPYRAANPTFPVFEQKSMMPSNKEDTQSQQSFRLDASTPLPKKQGAPPPAPTKPIEQNIFGVFDNEKTNLSLKVSVKLPKLSLIKEMYKNAKDKDSFLEHLTTHVKKDVTDDIIRESLMVLLEKRNYSRSKKNLKEDANADTPGTESKPDQNKEENND